ncbi:hypothetical protein ISCGN_014767 [Ixodes scapularis]
MVEPALCADGRFALADCVIGNELVRLISVYAPSTATERRVFFTELRALLETPAALIVGGDFNCVLNARDRMRGSTAPRADAGANTLRDAVRDFDIVDVTEVLDSFSPRFTRWQGPSQARLDRVYVSSELSDRIQSYDAKLVPFSDHGFVATVLRSGGPGPRRARRDTTWKMNASVLGEEEFVRETRHALEGLAECGVDAVSWEQFKEQLRESASAFGRRRAAEARQVRDHLTWTLKILLEEEEQDPGAFREDIKNCKDELLGLLEERYKGAQVRSRVEGLEGEIQPSKIFRTHERRRVKENALREVRGEGGVATSQEEIAAMFEEAYGKLFREEELDEDAFVSVLRGSPTVPDETTDVMNCPIRPSEVQQAIKKLSRNKAPGPDGIGAEFYKMFSDELSPILAEVSNDIESRKLLPPSMRESFTVLIPKKTKKGPIAETTDFRPISLLCCDYKILAKILARRLDIGLRKIIGPHQSYGIRGRSIARNLHVMRTVCEASAEGHQPLAVMQLDLRQAFDRVSHKFLLAALDHFGVGERLREWIALCYREIGTRLLINGVKGARIPIGRSVRQGCPLSPILFALQLEPLCRAISEDQSISGLQLGDGKDVSVLAFADDVAIICSSKKQVEAVLQHVDVYTAASGAEINPEKSMGAWLGCWATTPPRFAGICWSTSIGNYLGAPIDPGQSAAAVWRRAANSMVAKLSPWQPRYISVFNRVQVCNTVTYPAVFYKAQAVCCPGVTAKKIHRSWATFVWRSPWERTRRDNLFLHQESGGLGLVNIVIKLNVQRFLLFRDAKEPTLLSALHHLGFPYLGRWMVSTSGRTAKAAALRFYSEIAEAIQFFLALDLANYLATPCTLVVIRSGLYWDTVAATFPPPLYRPPPLPDGAARLFRFVRRLPAPTATKDFFVRMHMEVLPVKSWLHGKGVFVPWSLNCDLCGNTETIQHVLVECSNAYLFWDEMRTCFRLRSAFDVEWGTFKYLLLGDGEGTEVTSVLVLLGLHAIWQSRTAMVQCHLDARPTWDYFLAKLDWVVSVTGRGATGGADEWQGLRRQLESRRYSPWRRLLGGRGCRLPSGGQGSVVV